MAHNEGHPLINFRFEPSSASAASMARWFDRRTIIRGSMVDLLAIKTNVVEGVPV